MVKMLNSLLQKTHLWPLIIFKINIIFIKSLFLYNKQNKTINSLLLLKKIMIVNNREQIDIICLLYLINIKMIEIQMN